jgi:hypothetical protein
VTVNADMTVTIDDAPSATFSGQIFPARSSGGSDSDGSPRSTVARNLVWVAPAGPLLGPGDRIQHGPDVYEVLTPPVGRRAGLQVLVNEYEAAPVGSIYPLLATLSDLGGVEVETDMPVAIWEGSIAPASHGEYDDLSGEAPVEFYNSLRIVNRELVVGSRPFRITSTILHGEAGHVKLRLRSPDA